ncbi:MAG: hypothetical protein MPK62_06125 [Alphaproteobacteria bacterium]|nr:hypothetical protein [Alphaproteobacteria bacterium]
MRNHPRLNRRRRLVARLRNRRAEVGRKSERGEIILVRLLGVSDFCDGSSPFNVCPDSAGTSCCQSGSRLMRQVALLYEGSKNLSRANRRESMPRDGRAAADHTP